MSEATLTTLASINPANGEVVGEVPITPASEIPGLVARSRAAQPKWAALSLDERASILIDAGKRLAERADELGHLLTHEMGKPLREGIGEVKSCGLGMEPTVREIAEALKPEIREDERTFTTLYHDPFGVCATISPWNFPISMPHWMIIPALMAGNSVVLKPSEETPLIAQAYVDVLNEFLPKDVLLVVHGADDQGKALTAANVDLIAFTGSRETGKKILGAASGGLKRVILELGGKDPMIVLGDADLSYAARFAANNSFRNAGQVCVSTERIYVDESVCEAFEQALVEETKKLAVGVGTDEGVAIGPMINPTQKGHVSSQVEEAISAGARVVHGAEGHHGNFFMPTILADLSHEMGIMREETFGPVACIMPFRGDDEAVELANDTPFGLGAAVFGDDPERAGNVARRLTAGMIGINKGCGGAENTPWVGARESGYGFHSSKEGHRQFAQVRLVSSMKPKS